ncbi:hypothetical protein FISHEDRAFT_36430 [Fistulina hepatica ATCC 64428]|uniref:dolichol kinase n=1 Tax=Fistulina hepatica ATCC 64428 TaxID=1128425 RepID=A0A0D7AJ94_9AGAR|nr:hypothetical protein FISHEDRAFT_36430 [Fistulina hepatica ATCC 64428]
MPLGASSPFLPKALRISLPIPLTLWRYSLYVDFRQLGEGVILLVSLYYGILQVSHTPTFDSPRIHLPHYNVWTSLELHILASASLFYFFWTRSKLSKSIPFHDIPNFATSPPSSSGTVRGSSPRDSPRTMPRLGSDFGFIFMSVPKNYRLSADDGVLTGLLLPSIISCALLFLATTKSAFENPVPKNWLIELPATLTASSRPYTAAEALVLSRYSLCDLATLCSSILLLHVCASWWLEGKYSPMWISPDGERRSVPRSEGRRGLYYIFFTCVVTITILAVKVVCLSSGYGIWQNLKILEAVMASLIFQFAMYVGLRLAHRAFTLGELGLVCFGGTAHVMEFLNFTIAKLWPVTTPFINTYRLPIPLLVFQIALIAGSFLVGFLLAPFLVLSRHVAQRPMRRLRRPEDKPRHRRFLALGFYIGSVLIIGGLIGMWARWCLGNRDPWLWVIFYIIEGARQWSRPALLIYWALLASISVAAWNRQLARSRRYRAKAVASESVPSPWSADVVPPVSANGIASSFTAVNAAALNLNANMTHVATDLLDAADKRVPILRLNARRKFFHALAVVMFLPGVTFDPAFTHLAFSVAFALFTFAEYIRYFAISPFGASVHVFMSEFLDHKDGGTAILSHFYLLTGCAGGVWLEAPSRLISCTGILALGIGDALASIVGKRFGRRRWSPLTSKTLEGSATFVVSIIVTAWLLRLIGLVEPFSTFRYGSVVALSAVLEALSDQNDNLTLPLYMWSASVLFRV